MFVDEVDIRVTAGDGGRGAVSFRREKFVPRGGPDGGDGGPGGSVYLVTTSHTNTLVNYRFHPEFRARRGGHGEGSNRTGHAGADIELGVPIGTVVYQRVPGSEELVLLADLKADGERVLVARGGRGGRGNTRFATSTNRAPRRSDPGEGGEAKHLRLQLKLLADAGLVGFPNAGKSTLISRISAARPKIADYPFTTLTPHLGMVTLSDDRSFVVADVPGLIEGAHAGHGLGHQFLRHVERTKVLVYVVDVSEASGRDPTQDLDTVRRELELFQPALLERPQIAAANKMDVLADRNRLERVAARLAELSIPLFPTSAATGEGLPALLEAMWARIDQARKIDIAGATPAPQGAARPGGAQIRVPDK
jgi:GTP-binding protein